MPDTGNICHMSYVNSVAPDQSDYVYPLTAYKSNVTLFYRQADSVELTSERLDVQIDHELHCQHRR